MRRPWIKIEVSTPDKPEICSIATKLRIDPDAVVGKLVRLWSWAELNGINPNDLSVTKEFIDKVCGRKGFADALIESGWLLEAGKKLAFPNFSRHNGNASKVRGLTARRVEVHRYRNAKKNVKRVTKSDPATPEPAPEPPPSEPEVIDAQSVIIPDESLVLVEEPEITPIQPPHEESTHQALHEPIEPLTEPIEAPVAPAETPAAEEAPEEAEAKPKKRRAKAAAEADDQPMLF